MVALFFPLLLRSRVEPPDSSDFSNGVGTHVGSALPQCSSGAVCCNAIVGGVWLPLPEGGGRCHAPLSRTPVMHLSHAPLSRVDAAAVRLAGGAKVGRRCAGGKGIACAKDAAAQKATSCRSRHHRIKRILSWLLPTPIPTTMTPTANMPKIAAETATSVSCAMAAFFKFARMSSISRSA